MARVSRCLLLLILSCCFLKGSCDCGCGNFDDYFDDYEDCFCLNTTIGSEEEFFEKREGIIDFLWNVGLSEWTTLGNLFKGELILRTFNSDEAIDFAEMTIIYMSIFNPYLDEEPSACALAALINATVSCVQDNNSTELSELVNNGLAEELYDYITNMAHWNALMASKCPMDRDTYELISIMKEVPTWQCYENGFVYDIEGIWDLKGQNIPENTRKLVRDLYDSDEFTDKFTAAIATYSLLDYTKRIHEAFDKLTLFELLHLQYGPLVSWCCCDENYFHLQDLAEDMSLERRFKFDEVQEFYSSPDACKNGNY